MTGEKPSMRRIGIYVEQETLDWCDYLLQSLSSVMAGTVQDSENRIARMDFKIAVELSKLSQVIAYTHEVGEEALHKLHLKCVDEVKRINGAINFENAYKYQKRQS